ncbi:MAG TPA: hypothetical protein VGP04_12840 [Pseudonocardiaceae bacterium]|nr:hypothetical protein [Pseudonocardiaceae bacterium]
MSAPLPPHYRSFRIALVIVLVGALAGAAWWFAQPGVVHELLRLLHA